MAADKSVSVRVLGMGAVSTALKRLADQSGSTVLQEALGGIAGRIAHAARSKVPSASGRAAASIVAHATSRGARISWGGQRAEYMPWLDFGGTTGRGHKLGPNKGAIHRDWLGRPAGSGRYVYPTVSEYRAATIDAVMEAIVAAARAADFEVR